MQNRSSNPPKNTAEIPPAKADGEAKNPAAVELGRLGGLKGGKARAKKLSKSRRSEIAKQAAISRWRKTGKSSDKKDLSREE